MFTRASEDLIQQFFKAAWHFLHYTVLYPLSAKCRPDTAEYGVCIPSQWLHLRLLGMWTCVNKHDVFRVLVNFHCDLKLNTTAP